MPAYSLYKSYVGRRKKWHPVTVSVVAECIAKALDKAVKNDSTVSDRLRNKGFNELYVFARSATV